MTDLPELADLNVDLQDFVAVVEIARPPHNFFDFDLIGNLATMFEALDGRDDCRAIVLCAQGKSFCAGANFGDGAGERPSQDRRSGHLYQEAVRLFRCAKPVVAAVHGAAVGGGLGLAMVADFRVACAEARFAANFTRLGFHPGFGLTVTLPRVIGRQKADLMFLTSRRIKGEEAHQWGLLDILTTQDQVRDTAWNLAREIATNAPLGVAATRATLRQGLADAVRAATDRELQEQTRLRKTEDFKEGIAASHDRRDPDFKGR